MKSFSIFVAASLSALALASPVELDRRELSNVVVALADDHSFPGNIFVDAATGVVTVGITGNETTSKRDVEKRALTHIDVYFDSNFNGRHEALQTETQRCYGLGNGWEDSISSVRVYSPYSCDFYNARGCSGSEGVLHIQGTNNLAYVGDGSNDRISSYRCYD